MEPKSLEHAFRVERKFEKKIMGTRKSATYNYKEGSVVLNHPQPAMLMQRKIEEKITKIIFYNSDRIYIKGHKFTQKKLFYIDCEQD